LSISGRGMNTHKGSIPFTRSADINELQISAVKVQ
jgi:hypothetical protein